MTMLAHSIKPILELIPEALPFIKQASVDLELPLDNRDSCIATALELKYHEHVDHKSIDPFYIEKVAGAIDLYDVSDVVTDLSSKMIKAAQARSLELMNSKEERYLSKQANFEGSLSGFVDYAGAATEASALYKEASNIGVVPSEVVRRYSGNAFLDKKAAVEALAARFQLTQNTSFVKIASSLGRMDTFSLKPETVFDICKTVSLMDKEAGISAKGFDFFKEALLTKEAGSVLSVKLCNQQVPYEKIEKLGRDRISQYIGEDIAKEMDSGPANTKQVLETLPLDLQQILCNLLKNV